MNTFQGKPCRNGHSGVRYLSNKQCVECSRMAVKKWQAKNPEKTQDFKRDWDKRNPIKMAYYGAKLRARKRGMEFNIEMEDLLPVPDTCPVLGIPMDQPSLDRIDNSKGYVKGNVAVISDRANRLKRDATLDEVQALARWMSEQLSSP